MTEVKKGIFVKSEDLTSGAKLIQTFKKDGSFHLKKGRFCFYDTKHKSVY